MDTWYVVLCGGSGSRLWPLSTAVRPKQLVPLPDGRTLLQTTLDRCRGRVLCVSDRPVPGQETLVEPFANDTGVAIARAVEYVGRAAAGNPVLVILPSDHHIGNEAEYQGAVAAAVAGAGQDELALFGIEPTGPNPNYGYILGTEFVEKPDEAAARAYIAAGALWNSGIVLGRLQRLARECRVYGDWLERPRAGKSSSFDIGVLQRCGDIRVYAGRGWGWSDVGSWESFLALECVRNSEAHSEHSDKVQVYNPDGAQVVVLGASNLLVCVHGGRVLVMDRAEDRSAELKRRAQSLLHQD